MVSFQKVKSQNSLSACFYNERHRAPQAGRPAPASSFPGSHPPRPSITSHSPEPSGSTGLPSCVLIWGLGSQRALGPLLPCCALWAHERRPGRALLSDGTGGGPAPSSLHTPPRSGHHASVSHSANYPACHPCVNIPRFHKLLLHSVGKRTRM